MKHKLDCKMSFGRKDATCPRCQELIAGAKPITWTKNNDAARVRDIRNHSCVASKCGVICTYGEY